MNNKVTKFFRLRVFIQAHSGELVATRLARRTLSRLRGTLKHKSAAAVIALGLAIIAKGEVYAWMTIVFAAVAVNIVIVGIDFYDFRRLH
jgi:hypothetical protein